jgi:crotonobetainyl-CoA:carnitine CoA-transferase CaiB-like acyl-CoA transferase
MLVDIPLPYGIPGTLKLPNSPIHLSKTPPVVGRPMPEHGGDTAEVLEQWAGIGADEVAELAARGVVKVAGR